MSLRDVTMLGYKYNELIEIIVITQTNRVMTKLLFPTVRPEQRPLGLRRRMCPRSYFDKLSVNGITRPIVTRRLDRWVHFGCRRD